MDAADPSSSNRRRSSSSSLRPDPPWMRRRRRCAVEIGPAVGAPVSVLHRIRARTSGRDRRRWGGRAPPPPPTSRRLDGAGPPPPCVAPGPAPASLRSSSEGPPRAGRAPLHLTPPPCFTPSIRRRRKDPCASKIHARGGGRRGEQHAAAAARRDGRRPLEGGRLGDSCSPASARAPPLLQRALCPAPAARSGPPAAGGGSRGGTRALDLRRGPCSVTPVATRERVVGVAGSGDN
jgi:hypothetical protein